MRFWSVLAILTLVVGVGCGNLGEGCTGSGAGLDADGDGVVDTEDNCPMVANADQVDADEDGVGDACDADLLDPDGDGVEEGDNCPDLANAGQEDADEDGVGDACDNCVNTANEDQADADADDVGDACEGDRDNDGVEDGADNCLSVPNADQTDTDGDGVGDACDNAPGRPNPGQEDDDGDGVADIEDNCAALANAGQEDADEDGVGDACDNCVNTANEDQADADADDVGDVCEGDRDGDGVDDDDDNCLSIANADQADADSDGVGDVCDNCVDNANADQANADGDAVGDACDNCDAVANNDQADCDNDGIGNVCDNDDPCDTSGGGGGGADPVQIEAGGNKNLEPCETVTLDATTTTAGATITWKQTGGPDLGIAGVADPLTFIAPAEPAGLPAVYTFTATGTADGFTEASDSLLVTVFNFDSAVAFGFDATTSSGAAIPGDLVELTLASELGGSVSGGETQTFGEWRATWRQAPGGTPAVIVNPVVGPNGEHQSATFTAPAVAATTDLAFVAGVCRVVVTSGQPDSYEGTIALTESVSIQTATVLFNLPDGIVENDVVALADFVTLSGEPVGAELFFFATINGDAPVTIDNDTGTMTVGNDVGTDVEIAVQVIGTAGPLATATDTFAILQAPQ